jgi:hypothetical protein
MQDVICRSRFAHRVIPACSVAAVASAIMWPACLMSEAPRNMHSRRGFRRVKFLLAMSGVTLAVATAGLAVGWFAGQAFL